MLGRRGKDPFFYAQNGLTLEYYWPLDDRGGLSGDETEILAYNESGQPIEFTAANMTFTESGRPRRKISGTWEKFPSRASWERIEYISIPPSPYQGEPLLVQPGEKAKIHWHLEHVSSTDTLQAAVLALTVSRGGDTETIAPTLVRGSVESVTAALTAPAPIPVPTQVPHDTQQSANNDVHTDTGSTPSDSNVRWSFNGITWSPNGTPPECPEPFINPPVWLEQGEVVGTSVGIAPSNIFVDFGLYDVRKPNSVTPNRAWAHLFAADKEFGHYGVCFFDYLPGGDGQTMRSLPTGKEGKTSDFCQ